MPKKIPTLRTQHGLEEPDPEDAGHDGCAIGAGAEKHRVSEGQEPAVAEQQVEAEQRDGIPEERDHQGGVIGRRRDRQHHQSEHAQRTHDKGVAPRHASDFPNRPAGRHSKTAITMK